jgi:hypothetical protein
MITKGKISHYIALLGVSSLLVFSCVDDSDRRGRSLIEKFGETQSEAPGLCTDIFDLTTGFCQTECPTGTHLASEQEKAQAINELETSGGDPDQIASLLENIASAEGGVCVQGSGVLRPDGAIFIESDVCGCKAGKEVTSNNCAAQCSGRSDAAATLFGRVTLGPEVALNTIDLGNLFNWCNNEITGSDLTSPGCSLELFDGESTQFLPINIPQGSNTFNVNIESLPEKKVFVATIVETQSGSNVRSNSFQIFKKDPDDDQPVTGPLKIMPVSQYTCVTRISQENLNDNTFSFEAAAKIHFYFPSTTTPPSLPSNVRTTVCHDINLNGLADDPLHPRLELIPQDWAIWDQSDSRFVDINGDGNPDINQVISDRLLAEANISRQLNIFSLLRWPNMPNIEGFTKVAAPNLGFFMQSFIDPLSQRAFCPNQTNYNSGDPIFSILREVVGVNTEAIFLAESEPNVQGTEIVQDVIFMREGLLKKVWFFVENGQLLVPDDVTANSKTIHFFHPPDPNDPFLKKPHQLTYTVRFPSDIGQQGNIEGLNTVTRPPDKRFGCVPAID